MANSKLTGLTATTTPVSTDIFYIVTDPGGTPTSQKVTGANMAKALGFGTNVLTFLTTPTSANLTAAVTGGTIAFLGTVQTFTATQTFGTINATIIQSPTTLTFKTNGTTTALTLGTDQSATFTGLIKHLSSPATPTVMFLVDTSGGGSTASSALGQFNADGTTGSFGVNRSGLAAPLSNAFFFRNNTANNILFQTGSSINRILVDGMTGNVGIGGVITATDLTGAVLSVLANGTVGINKISPGAILDIGATANQTVLKSTGYSLTGSSAVSMVDLAGTLNTSGSPDVILLNITNTASGAATTLINLKVGGTSMFSVSKAGAVNAVSYSVGGAAGASFGPGLPTTITVVNGIVTAIA